MSKIWVIIFSKGEKAMIKVINLKFEMKSENEKNANLSDLRSSDVYRYFAHINGLTPMANMRKERSECCGYRFED